MERLPRRFRRWVAAPALAGLAAALPVSVGHDGSVEVQRACAQGGYCRPHAGWICFYNGVAYLDYEYVDGSGG